MTNDDLDSATKVNMVVGRRSNSSTQQQYKTRNRAESEIVFS